MYGMPIHYFLYNIIIQKQHQNNEEEGKKKQFHVSI